MFSKIYQKIKQVLRFFVEKPGYQVSKQWVHSNKNDDTKGKKREPIADSRSLYIPYQLNYFLKQKSSSSQDNSWDTEKLVKMSSDLGKAYAGDRYFGKEKQQKDLN